jgi:hypothetical protein
MGMLQARARTAADNCFAHPGIEEPAIELWEKQSFAGAVVGDRFATQAIASVSVSPTAVASPKRSRAARPGWKDAIILRTGRRF